MAKKLEWMPPDELLRAFESGLKAAPDAEATETLRREIRRRLRVESALGLMVRDMMVHAAPRED